MRAGKTIGKAEAEDLAVRALTFLAGDDDRLRRFLDLSGLEAGGVRTAAASPDFLAGVLDYIVADENLLLAMSASAGEPPERIAAAQKILSPSELGS